MNACDAFFNNRHVYLVSDPGTGKTVMAKEIFAVAGLPGHCFDFGASSKPSEFYGKLAIRSENGNKETRFLDGAFTECVRNGYGLILNEFPMASEDVTSGLLNFLQNKSIMLKHNAVSDNEGFLRPEYLEAAPNFRIIATANSGGCIANTKIKGNNKISAATLSRFDVIHVPTHLDADALMIRYKKDKRADYMRKWANILAEDITPIWDSFYKTKMISFAWNMRTAEDFLRYLYFSNDPQIALKVTIQNKLPQDQGANVVEIFRLACGDELK